jgi:hypothetical protein
LLRQDFISISFLGVALFINIYIFTYQPTFEIFFPDALIATAYILEKRLKLEEKHEEIEVSKDYVKNSVKYTFIGFLGILAINFAIGTAAPPSHIPNWANIDPVNLAFSILMAIAETQVFQAVLLDDALIYLPKRIPILNGHVICFAIAGVITWYHSARYGDSPNALIYVLIGFWIINEVAYRTRRLGPPTLVHVANNIYATVGFGMFNITGSNPIATLMLITIPPLLITLSFLPSSPLPLLIKKTRTFMVTWWLK